MTPAWECTFHMQIDQLHMNKKCQALFWWDEIFPFSLKNLNIFLGGLNETNIKAD